jgi:hypothetical protein
MADAAMNRRLLIARSRMEPLRIADLLAITLAALDG